MEQTICLYLRCHTYGAFLGDAARADMCIAMEVRLVGELLLYNTINSVFGLHELGRHSLTDPTEN